MNLKKDKLLKETIGEIWLSKEAKNNMTFLTDELECRFAGSEYEHSAADFIKHRFKNYELSRVSKIKFEFQGWNRVSTYFKIDKPVKKNLEAISLPYCPSCNIKGKIMDLGCGTSKDFRKDIKGKMVMVSSRTPEGKERWIHRKEKYRRAVEGGASAFIYMNHEPGQLYQTGSLNSNKMGQIPGIGISRETGYFIKRKLNKTENVEAKIEIEVESKKALSHNITGTINKDLPDKEILICGHYDSHDISPGAMDNAAGVTTLLEVARMTEKIKNKIKSPLRFVTFGAEELGLTGSRKFVESEDCSNVGLVLNFDCLGNGRNITFLTGKFRNLEEILKEISIAINHNLKIDSRLMPHSDHWPFIKKGIPGCHIFSSDREKRGRGWAHTISDTPDKVEIKNIKDNAIVMLLTIIKLSENVSRLKRKAPGEIKKILKEEGHYTP